MSDEIKLDGLGLAPGVFETIITLATEQVEGVAAVCTPGFAGIVGKGVGKAGTHLVEAALDENGKATVAVHIQAKYGTPLHEVARAVQASIADAIKSQLAIETASVDVFVDGVTFEG